MSGHGWDIDGYVITKVLYMCTSSVAVVVTTGFKPKSKLPVNLGRLWTVGNIELDQTYISAHRFDTYILLDCGRGTIK